MKNIKTLIALLLCVLLVFSAFGCRRGGDSDTSDTNATGTEIVGTETTGSENTDTESTDSGVTDTEVAPTEQNSPNDTPQSNDGGEVVNPPANTQVNTPGAVSESAKVKSDYFDNVAFVGDSVSLKLSYYAASTGCLGKAQFFTAGSLGANNALWEISDESVHPSYRGEKTLIEDCIALSGVKQVYIMLGMNDIGLYGVEDTIKSYETLISRILKESPDVKIVIQSMTPMTSTSTILGSSLNNENIKLYNQKLSDLCAAKGWAFVDVASVMYDAQGVNLNPDYCSDPVGLGVHFTEAGCDAWVEYLSTHTP